MHRHPMPSPPSLPAAPPSLCAIHGVAKVLRLHGHGSRRVLRCPRCERDAGKRFRERHLKRQLDRVLRAEALQVRDCFVGLLKSWGGWERLIAGLPGEERARLALKLAEGSAELEARAREEERKKVEAVKSASKDVGVVAAAAEILKAAGWTIAPPGD